MLNTRSLALNMGAFSRIGLRANAIAIAVCISFLGAIPAAAVPTTFSDLPSYNTAVAGHGVITFQGLAADDVVTTQFAGQGADFTDGDDTVTLGGSFASDGIGIHDNGSTTVVFSNPQDNFGVEFPGAARIELFDGITLVFSGDFGGAGTGLFGGVLLDGATFDSVVLSDWSDGDGFYDNLHFGNTTVPEPGTASLMALGLAGLVMHRRKARR